MKLHLELNNKNIDNKKFLSYFIDKMNSKGINRTGIKRISFNKKSISVTIDKDIKSFFFNDFYTEKSLYSEILSFLKSYIIENNLFMTVDFDFYKYKFEKININYK